ncbi:hypothetical protein [Mycolicibacter heraklionensis]|uniref:DUF7427 family protein n=1 Tax=Mycolicibacter heraklionensis TaxID=512402 RepID=UPI001041EA82|nr:hypothetical protein [Mycolicibacter heraklionensis]
MTGSMRPADRAWLAGAVAITAWDLFGPETLSSAADRYHQSRPWLTRGIVLYLALHLLSLIPARGDPLCLLLLWKRPRP